MDTIKLKRATKSVANASTKVLEKDEVLVVTPDSGSGKGKCQLKFGDGITAAKSLPIAIDGENADEMKVSTIPTDSDENPVLSAGETVKVFFGKIKKKFTYLENLVGNVKSVTNLFGNTDAKTVAQGLQILVNTKLSKTDKYDGVDSTSTELWATANAVRKVNEKTDNNSTSIRELNSNLVNLPKIIECGNTTFTKINANTYADINITFTKVFDSAPSIQLTDGSKSESVKYGSMSPSAINITSKGFTIRYYNNTDYTPAPYVMWTAIL